MKTDGSKDRKINEGEKQIKAFTKDVTKSVNEEKRTIDFIISNETVDRHGDIVTLKGWQLDNFMENPVVLFAHSRAVPPIGKALKVWKSGGNLNATAQFMTREMSPFADSVFEMFKEGYLKAVSVGFMPEEWEFIKEQDGDDEWITGFKFLKQELLEFSAVPVPSNPDALMKARHKGLNVEPIGEWAESVLDDWANSGTMVSEVYNCGKKQIELIRRKAIGDSMTTYHVSEEQQKELLEKNLKSIEEQRKAKANKVDADDESDDKPKPTECPKEFELNKDAFSYADTLISKGNVNLSQDRISGTSDPEPKFFLSKTKDDEAVDHKHQIIDGGTVFRQELVEVKRKSVLDGDIPIFTASSRLLSKIDGDKKFEKNKFKDWDSHLEVKDIDTSEFEPLDAYTYEDDNGEKSVFFNNAPTQLVIQESLFKSSGGAVSFMGTSDSLNINFGGANTDLSYFPYAKNSDGDYICHLDVNGTVGGYVVPTTTTVPRDVVEPFMKSNEPVMISPPEDKNVEPLDENVIEPSPDESEEKGDDKDLMDDEPLTVNEKVDLVEQLLIDIEETLEKDADLIHEKKGDKRFIRKLKFVVQYMREFANMVSPIRTETTTTVTEGTIPVKVIDDKNENDDGMTMDEVDDYLENKLAPKLDKIVEQNLNKLRGRLD